MADAIVNGSPFINCRGGANQAGVDLFLRLHREWEVGKDIWYKMTKDFNGDAWTLATNVDTEDGTRSGAGRKKTNVTGFDQTLDFTINNDFKAPFNQTLYDVTLHGDEYFFDFLRDGIDVKIVTRFPDGSHTEKVYECNSVVNAGALYDQLDNADTTSDFQLALNNEPTVKLFGFSPKLPRELTEVTANVSVTVTDLQIDVKIDNVVDADSLVVDDTWVASVIDNLTGDVVQTGTSNVAPHEFSFNVQSLGDYTVAVGYVYYKKDQTTEYARNISIKQVTATAPAGTGETQILNPDKQIGTGVGVANNKKNKE